MKRFTGIKNIFLIVSLFIFLNPYWLFGFDITNLNKIKKEVGFSDVISLLEQGNKKINVKIAIFDNGFKGVKEALGSKLPLSTQIIEFDKSPNESLETSHGYFMSQILFNLLRDTKNLNESGVQIYLYRVTGFTNFKKAIDHAIANKVQVILHSMVRDYGSNFDGKGFFNAEVNRATESGILWINAAGNFGSSTYHLENIDQNDEGWVKLPWNNQALTLDCLPPKNSKIKTCDLRLILGWNDFKDNPILGTDKDLDLHLSLFSNNQFYDYKVSQLIQSLDSELKPGQSLYPREIIETQLSPGRYFIRVKNRSFNFLDSDALYITTDSEFIRLGSYSKEENLFNPADNPNVITVGAYDTERSSQSRILNKPELFLSSRIELSNDEVYLGSSNAAAIGAAAVGLLLSFDPSLTKDEIVNLLTDKKNWDRKIANQNSKRNSHNLNSLQGVCYQEVALSPYESSYPLDFLLNQKDGQLIRLFDKTIVMVSFSPWELVPRHFIQRLDDMIVVSPFGIFVRPRSHETYLLSNEFEVLSQKDVGFLCQEFENTYDNDKENLSDRYQNLYPHEDNKILKLPLQFFE